MFKPQFAALVESGAKQQTVRPTPKRLPKAGDRISLRMWTGKPYRSKQRILRDAMISEVASCEIYSSDVYVGGYPQPRDEFAVADGFANYEELCKWFQSVHGLPFSGILIKWSNE